MITVPLKEGLTKYYKPRLSKEERAARFLLDSVYKDVDKARQLRVPDSYDEVVNINGMTNSRKPKLQEKIESNRAMRQRELNQNIHADYMNNNFNKINRMKKELGLETKKKNKDAIKLAQALYNEPIDVDSLAIMLENDSFPKELKGIALEVLDRDANLTTKKMLVERCERIAQAEGREPNIYNLSVLGERGWGHAINKKYDSMNRQKIDISDAEDTRQIPKRFAKRMTKNDSSWFAEKFPNKTRSYNTKGQEGYFSDAELSSLGKQMKAKKDAANFRQSKKGKIFDDAVSDTTNNGLTNEQLEAWQNINKADEFIDDVHYDPEAVAREKAKALQEDNSFDNWDTDELEKLFNNNGRFSRRDEVAPEPNFVRHNETILDRDLLTDEGIEQALERIPLSKTYNNERATINMQRNGRDVTNDMQLQLNSLAKDGRITKNQWVKYSEVIDYLKKHQFKDTKGVTLKHSNKKFVENNMPVAINNVNITGSKKQVMEDLQDKLLRTLNSQERSHNNTNQDKFLRILSEY